MLIVLIVTQLLNLTHLLFSNVAQFFILFFSHHHNKIQPNIDYEGNTCVKNSANLICDKQFFVFVHHLNETMYVKSNPAMIQQRLLHSSFNYLPPEFVVH